MILCRFADQTAVQLPEERRLMGTTSEKKNNKKWPSNLLLNETPRGQTMELVLMNVAFETSDPGGSCLVLVH